MLAAIEVPTCILVLVKVTEQKPHEVCYAVVAIELFKRYFIAGQQTSKNNNMSLSHFSSVTLAPVCKYKYLYISQDSLSLLPP